MSFEFLLEKKSQKETCKFAIIKKFYVEIYSPSLFKGVVHKFNKKKEFSMKSGVCHGVL